VIGAQEAGMLVRIGSARVERTIAAVLGIACGVGVVKGLGAPEAPGAPLLGLYALAALSGIAKTGTA
jgi:hypothetical protein